MVFKGVFLFEGFILLLCLVLDIVDGDCFSQKQESCITAKSSFWNFFRTAYTKSKKHLGQLVNEYLIAKKTLEEFTQDLR